MTEYLAILAVHLFNPWNLVHIWLIYDSYMAIYDSYMTHIWWQTPHLCVIYDTWDRNWSHIWTFMAHIWFIYDIKNFIYDSYMRFGTSYMCHIWAFTVHTCDIYEAQKLLYDGKHLIYVSYMTPGTQTGLIYKLSWLIYDSYMTLRTSYMIHIRTLIYMIHIWCYFIYGSYMIPLLHMVPPCPNASKSAQQSNS